MIKNNFESLRELNITDDEIHVETVTAIQNLLDIG